MAGAMGISRVALAAGAGACTFTVRYSRRAWPRDTLERAAIIQQSSTHWKLERMARVDRNILRLAVYEILRRADIPVRVTLNEAIELGKKFGSEESSSFVNGVLDRIAHLELPNATPKLEKKD